MPQDKISHLTDTNPKKWWDNIKLISGLSKPPPLSNLSVNGSIARGNDLAEKINHFFSNLTNDIAPLQYTPIQVTQISDDYIISPESVERSLLSIKVRKSIGPDDIPNWLLKNFASSICRPVCSIFNSSIRQGHVPVLWKSADVLPIPKMSNPQSIESDLRPISLTPVLSKLLEDNIFQWLCPIILPQIDPRQFGCIKKSSSTHALIHLLHTWLASTETPKTFIRCCLVDFSKAFDRIDHNILISKLRLLNVPPILLNWCASFLQNRQQRVKLGNVKSGWKFIHAGVPQGTKLGPLFFLVMINDLTTTVPMYKFVDDVTMSEIISLQSNEVDSNLISTTSCLQDEINILTRWTSANNMKLNEQKTKEFIVSFLKTQPLLQPLIVNNQPLERVNKIKLLGLYLSSDLKWSTHIDYICSKASKRLFALRILRRSGVSLNDLCSVFCYFIRPVLEYACPVWHSSLTINLSQQVEHIQQRALRIIYPNLSYKDSLVKFNLTSLFNRRESLCKSFYTRNLDSSSKLHDLFPNPVHNRYNLRHSRKIPLFKCRTKRFQDSFLPFCIRKWDAPL